MTRRAAFWAVFAALLALYAHGFREGGLFAQQVWSATGLARAVWFVAAYAAATGALLLAARRWYAPALAAASVAYAVAACGVAAVAAVALLLASSWALGRRATPGLAGAVLGLNVWAWLVGVAVHFPVNSAGVYGAALLLPVAFEWRRVLDGARAAAGWLRAGCELSWAEGAAVAALGLPLAMYLAVAAGPETGADALAMHLAIPASVEAHQRWVFDPRHTAWAVMPMQANWCFTAAYLLGGEAAARLINFAALALTAALLYGLARRILARAGALWLAALFASSPVLLLVTGSLFAENFWSLTLLGAFVSLVRYRESGRARWALTAAALAGCGLATKYGSLAFALPAALALGLEIRRRRAWRLAPAMLVLFALFGLPPYARAYFETGNPVFPFFNHVFRSPYFDSGQPFADARFARPLPAATFYDATFRTSRHLEGQNGGWGFQYLFFVPLALLCWRREAAYAGHAALGIGLGFTVLTMAGQSNIRYLCPALPLLTLAAGGLLRRRAGLAASLAVFGLNLWFLPASGWYHKDFAPGILDAPARERFLAAAAPVRNLTAWLNRERPNEPVAFLESNQIAGLRGAAFTAAWHNHAFAGELSALESPEQAWDLLARHELWLLIAPAGLERVTHPHLRRLLFARGRGFNVALILIPQRQWQADAKPEDALLVRSALKVVLSQRLVRQLCSCARRSTDPADALELPVTTFWVPVGCKDCGGTGYLGRLALVELLLINSGEVGRAILARSDTRRLERVAIEAGMVTRWQRGLQAIEQGLTSPAELRRALGSFGDDRILPADRLAAPVAVC